MKVGDIASIWKSWMTWFLDYQNLFVKQKSVRYNLYIVLTIHVSDERHKSGDRGMIGNCRQRRAQSALCWIAANLPIANALRHQIDAMKCDS